MPADQALTEHWVGVDQVAAHLGVRKDSVYRWIDGKGLPARKIGKLWMLKLSEVDAWIEARNSHGSAQPRRHRDVPGSAACAQASGSRQPRILVVGGDATICAALAAFLSDEGYEPLLASDGAQALQLLRSAAPPPDLIILDLAMPVMDGRQFGAEQLCDAALVPVPVIVVTAEAFAAVPGAAAVLRRPLNLERLSCAIARAVLARMA
jgi:excisionase family DNA binding protein